MNGLDVIILLIILGAGFLGFRVGVMRAAFLLGAFVLGTLVGAAISAIPSTTLEKLISNPDMRELLVFVAIFLPVFTVVNIIGSVACKSVRSKPLKWIDCMIGTVLGLLVGFILAGLVVAYLVKSPTSNSEEWLEGSGLVPFIKSVISPMLQEFLKERVDESTVVLNQWYKTIDGRRSASHSSHLL